MCNTYSLEKLWSAGKLYLTDASEKDWIICNCNFGFFMNVKLKRQMGKEHLFQQLTLKQLILSFLRGLD